MVAVGWQWLSGRRRDHGRGEYVEFGGIERGGSQVAQFAGKHVEKDDKEDYNDA